MPGINDLGERKTEQRRSTGLRGERVDLGIMTLEAEGGMSIWRRWWKRIDSRVGKLSGHHDFVERERERLLAGETKQLQKTRRNIVWGQRGKRKMNFTWPITAPARGKLY